MSNLTATEKRVANLKKAREARAANRAKEASPSIEQLQARLAKAMKDFDGVDDEPSITQTISPSYAPSIDSGSSSTLKGRDLIRCVSVMYADQLLGDTFSPSDAEFASHYSKYDLPDDQTIIETFYRNHFNLPFGYLKLCDPLEPQNKERNRLLCIAIQASGGQIPDYYKPPEKRDYVSVIPVSDVFDKDPNPTWVIR